MSTLTRRSPILVVGIAIGLVIGAAELAGGAAIWQVAVSTVIPIAYAVLITLLARRSEAVSVLAGRPVDERWALMNQEAAVWAFGLSAIAVLGAFAVARATGGDWLPYALVGAAMAVAYVGSLAVILLRG